VLTGGEIAGVVIGVVTGVGLLAMGGMKLHRWNSDKNGASASDSPFDGGAGAGGRLSRALITDGELEADGETIVIQDGRKTNPLVKSQGPDPASL
jgi:hypothetical protein